MRTRCPMTKWAFTREGWAAPGQRQGSRFCRRSARVCRAQESKGLTVVGGGGRAEQRRRAHRVGIGRYKEPLGDGNALLSRLS